MSTLVKSNVNSDIQMLYCTMSIFSYFIK